MGHWLTGGLVGAGVLIAVLASTVHPLPLLALAGVLGGLGGACVRALQLAVGRLPLRWRLPMYLALGAPTFLVAFALPLGAWNKLHGPHRVMAAMALAGAVVVGCLVGCLLFWASRFRDLEPLGRRGWSLALGVSLGLGVLGLICATFEASQPWLRSYPSARHALFGFGWFCCTLAVLAQLRLVSSKPKRWIGGFAGAAFFVALASLPFVDADSWTTLVRQPHAERWVRLGRSLTDFDGDGFSAWLGGGDCAPFDPAVSPGVREIPGNGIDDNCRYGDATLMPRPPPRSLRPAAPAVGLPDVVLITIDALRADRTTPYGYGRNTTPNLAQFAAQAVRYTHAYTSGGWTCLAVSSLFSGVYPRRIRWKPVVLTTKLRLLELPYEGALRPDEGVQVTYTLPADDFTWWLPLALQQRGYHTAAVANRIVKPMFDWAFSRGWETSIMHAGLDDVDTVDAALALLPRLQTPTFLWVHLFDPHEPQTEHPDVPAFGGTMSDKYDHEVASTDRQLGRLLAALDARPNTVVIITADHGEGFAGGFQLHGVGLWEDVMHIPLLVRAPGWRPGVNDSPASLVDLAPTILALTQTEAPNGLDGRNLKQLTGDASVITDLVRLDERGHLIMEEMAATNRSFRLWHGNLRQTDVLSRTGDLTRPPVELPRALIPPELSAALAHHIESSLPP